MNTFQKTSSKLGVLFTIAFIFSITFISCSKDESIIEDDEVAQEDTTDGENAEESENDTNGDQNEGDSDSTGGESEESSSCTNPENFVFVENNGLLVAEFEDSKFSGDWRMKSNKPNFSGDGFLVWSGNQSLSNPGNGLISFKIKIENTGTYQFLWNSAVTTGNNGTEHNDTWLRFADADNFYGKKGDSKVYPKGTGKSPNPKGASADGWFKIYRSGSNLDFKWQAKTSDHDAHDIYVRFDTPGIYTMEVSARSSGHAIDKFVLFKAPYSAGDATGEVDLSAIECD